MNRKLLSYGLLTLFIIVASLPAALSLKIKTDIASLLPKGEAFAVAQSATGFPALRVIHVMIESPVPLLPSAQTGSAIDGFATAIRGLDGVATVRAGLNDDETISLFRPLFASRFHLIGYDEATALRTISLLPMKLTLPGGDALRANLGSDPLGSTGQIAAILQGGSRGSMGLIDGRFADDGGKRVFITVRSRYGSRSIGEMGELIAHIERIFAGEFAQRFPAGTTLAMTGGAVLATDAAGIMKNDLSLATALSVAGLILFFLFILRSFRLPLLFIPPVAVGTVTGMAGMSLIQGEIHGLTLGFGIALTGMCIDYLIHIIVAYSIRGNMEVAISEVFPSIAIAFATTVCALLVLSFSELPVIREIAILGIIGLSAAFLVSMTFCVALAERFRLAPILTPTVTMTRQPGKLFIGAIVLVTALLGLFALQTGYDGNLKHLSSNHPEVEAAFARMRQSLDGGSVRWLAVSAGANDATAYEACGRLAEALDAKGLSYTSPCRVIPPVSSQIKNLDSYRTLNRKRLEGALESAGMRAEAFTPFFRDLDAALAGKIPPLTASSLPASFMKETIEDATVRNEKGVSLMTAVESAGAAPVREAVNSAKGNVLFDFGDVEKGVVALLQKELPVMLATCAALIWIGLVLYYGDLRRASLILLPPAVSMVWLLGTLKIFGYDVNAVVLCCIVFQFGIGTDYGAYALGSRDSLADHSISQTSILLAAATTIISFGALLTATSPALLVVGLSICTGILGSMFVSRLLTLVPVALLVILCGAGCASSRTVALVAEPVTFTGTVELARPNGTARVYLSRLDLDPSGYRLALLIPPGIPYLAAKGDGDRVRADCAFSTSACLYDAQVLTKALKLIFDGETGGGERTGPGYTIRREPRDGGWAAMRTLEYREQRGYLFRFVPSAG